MQRKNHSKPNHKKNGKSPSKKKKGKKGQLKTNLSYGIALILFCMLGALGYYWQFSEKISLSPDTRTDSSQQTKADKRKAIVRDFKGVTLKYDHSFIAKNQMLVKSRLDTEPPVPLLFRANALRVWNHDPSDFTQGFEITEIKENGEITILESTGLYAQSLLKTITLSPNGQSSADSKGTLPVVPQSIALKDEDFGEGCTVYYDHSTRSKSIYQLTWKEKKVFVYDLDLKLLRTLPLPKEMKEGWGLYHDFESGQFIATDGSANIFFIDEFDFKVVKTLRVKYMNNDREGKDHKVIALKNLNEIEMVNGWILANVWYNTNIYIISPVNGFVYGIIECWRIFPDEVKRQNQRHAVLNGIAFDYVKNQLIITGKNWPKIFAIELPAFMLDASV